MEPELVLAGGEKMLISDEDCQAVMRDFSQA
jgi:hypothetical protein